MAIATPYSEKTDEQKAITEMVRQFADEQIIPNAEHYDHEDEFPEPIVEQMKELGLFGVTIPEEYGGMGLDLATYALIVEELSRGWISISGVVNTHFIGSYLLMKFGTEEQKQYFLPKMATGEIRAAFSLSEPEVGSDVQGIKATAKKGEDGNWELNGQKMWITNCSASAVAVVWAQTDEGVRGFVVPKGTPGFTTQDIHKKLSLRASITSELLLDDVRLPGDAVLPDVTGLRGPLSCLNEARYGIFWGALGAARTCYETALEYAQARQQFGAPIAAFQLTQEKLANMAVELAKGQLLALHFGRMKDQGRLAPEHVSIAKLNSTREALEICRSARTVLGGNGISYEFPIMRHMANLESVLTYEGTPEMHTLVIGQALTGHSAFRS